MVLMVKVVKRGSVILRESYLLSPFVLKTYASKSILVAWRSAMAARSVLSRRHGSGGNGMCSFRSAKEIYDREKGQQTKQS